uniref:acyl-[acyl-carrier-protein] thioesterase n=1 Tax=Flavobacterium sp. TaxID=239 RepID=UPI0040499AA6
MPIASNFSSTYSHQWTINFLQCDSNGVLRYTDLCHLLQLTAHEHSVLGGLSFKDMQVFQQAWVLSNMYLEIDALPKWEETITIKTWIVSMQDAYSIRALEVWQNDKKIAGALTHWAVLNTQLRKTEKLALPYEHFTFFPEKIPTHKQLHRILALKAYDSFYENTVKSSDLDLVNHVNNVKYLEWCLDTLEINELLNQKIKSIHMNFLREMHWNQAYKISKKKTSNEYHFAVQAEKNCYLLTIELND